MFQMFNKIKPSASNLTTGAIEQAKAKSKEQQASLEKLLLQQAALSASIAQSQQQLEASSHHLADLESQQLQEQQEAELAEEVQRLRPLADRINQLSRELFAATNEFRARIEPLRDKPGARNKFSIQDAPSGHDLPVVAHQKGEILFFLMTRGKLQQQGSNTDSSFWKNAQNLL
jgi:dynactin complex subunit